MSERKIYLGGGCFWCIEAVYERVDGIVSARSGYMGGHVDNPTYEAVCRGTTGHAEVVEIVYDSDKISLGGVLDVFWLAHDPTTLNRQGADVGTQYRSAIYFDEREDEALIKASITALEDSGKVRDPVVTEVLPAVIFYPAETYHDQYYSRNPNQGYCAYVIQPKLEKLGLG